jgi:hypothetical protein
VNVFSVNVNVNVNVNAELIWDAWQHRNADFPLLCPPPFPFPSSTSGQDGGDQPELRLREHAIVTEPRWDGT